jgi:hypothetical protein
MHPLSCSDYHGTVLEGLDYQPLLAAVHTAFAGHRPLVLTPDAVWLTIVQGVAHHMAVHGERLRSRFVAHGGQLKLEFRCRDWVIDSPENPWDQAFDSWAGQIRDHVGADLHDALACDFSTSGPVERAAGNIVMMDVFEQYFHFVATCICGIPSVTLEGTPADWERLEQKAAKLSVFEMDWWLKDLLPICQQFVRAIRGDVDTEHWRGICKLRSAYGGDVINGWVGRLFPYLRSFVDGPCDRVNPLFETGEGFQSLVAPSGLSEVPFTWVDERAGETRELRAVGGLLGVTQDPATMALRPKVGWAVRHAWGEDVLLARVAAPEHLPFPGTKVDPDLGLPPDLAAFYFRANGADLFVGDPDDSDAVPACCIVPVEDLLPLDWADEPAGRTWHRFALLNGGQWLAIDLDAYRMDAGRRDDVALKARKDELGARFAPICLGSRGTAGQPGRNPVIALYFGEFLRRFLDGFGKPYWREPDFVPYGDADDFVRRPR